MLHKWYAGLQNARRLKNLKVIKLSTEWVWQRHIAFHNLCFIWSKPRIYAHTQTHIHHKKAQLAKFIHSRIQGKDGSFTGIKVYLIPIYLEFISIFSTFYSLSELINLRNRSRTIIHASSAFAVLFCSCSCFSVCQSIESGAGK